MRMCGEYAQYVISGLDGDGLKALSKRMAESKIGFGMHASFIRIILDEHGC